MYAYDQYIPFNGLITGVYDSSSQSLNWNILTRISSIFGQILCRGRERTYENIGWT